jgi:hypothetical protein
MNARTCLLCGKSLGRIWVGAGDDFCSREHGNQYRLKRGMDRLTETNKISSLMRKRENPKPITAAQLPLDFASARRDFPEVSIPAAGRTRLPSLRSLSVSSTPRISTVSESCVAPRLPRRAGPSEPRQPDTSFFRFPARKLAPVAPVREAQPPLRMPLARAARLPRRVLGSGGKQRDFGALRHAAMRANAGSGGMAPSRVEPPGAACFGKSRRPRGIAASPRTSGVRELSRGFGSRRLARRTPLPPASPAPRSVGLHTSARALGPVARQPLSNVRDSNARLEPRMLASVGRRSGLVYPSFVAPVNPTAIRWPGASRIRKWIPCHGNASAVREWGPLWNVSGRTGFSAPRRSLAAIERAMSTSCAVALPLAPVRANGAHRHVALAPFAPQNSPFGYKEYQEK